MLSTLTSWIILAVGGLLLAAVLHWFLKTRDISNKLLIVASGEFFEASDKLLKTPQELPDSVLDAMETMIASMNNGNGARGILKILREINGSDRDRPSNEVVQSALGDDVAEMREELRELFGHLVAAWLNYVTNRHVFYQFAITSEVRRLAVKTRSVDVDTVKTGMSLLPKMHAVG